MKKWRAKVDKAYYQIDKKATMGKVSNNTKERAYEESTDYRKRKKIHRELLIRTNKNSYRRKHK